MQGNELDDLFGKIEGKTSNKPKLGDVVGKRMRPVLPMGFDQADSKNVKASTQPQVVEERDEELDKQKKLERGESLLGADIFSCLKFFYYILNVWLN